MAGPSLNRVRAAPFRDRRDYFHRPTRVAAWKVRLALLALLVTIGWAAVAVASRTHLYSVTTHGELARAHAPWMNQCDACHVPHGSGDAGNGLFAVRDRWRTFRCETCHAGPAADPKNYGPHYDRTKNPHLVDDAQARDCSSCHHDHRGKDFDLARVSDGECVRCHRDLSPLHGTGPSITSFPADHPEFAVFDHKPKERAFKFNHALHLAVGLTESTNLDNPNAAFTLGKVAPEYQGEYARFSKDGGPAAALQLDCSSCHQLGTDPAGPRAGGATRLPAANLHPAGAAGAYYLPVTFEQHCQGCHTLKMTGRPSPVGVDVEAFTVPHRLRRADVENFVRGEVTRQVAAHTELFPKVALPPNDRLDTPRPIPVPNDLKKETDRLVGLYAGMLFDQSGAGGGHSCFKCHRAQSDGEVQPARGFTLWMPKARFDHAPHRLVDCAACHDTWARGPFVRYANVPNKGDEGANVPGIRTCQRCHAPTSFAVEGKPAAGIRSACITCHAYHKPTHGQPAAGDRLTIDALIRGVRPQ
jgi:hypothetical protein